MHIHQILLLSSNPATDAILFEALCHRYRLWSAKNFEEGLLFLEQEDINLIIWSLDNNCKISHVVAFKEQFLKKIDSGKTIKTLVVGPRNDESLIKTAYEVGISGYIGKPLIEQELLTVIDQKNNHIDLLSDFDFLSTLHLDYARFTDTFLLNTGDGMCLLDENNHIQSINLACAHLFKYNQECLIGKDICSLFDGTYHAKLTKLLRRNGNEKFYNKKHEMVGICSNGGKNLVDIAVSPVTIINNKQSMMCVINDSRISNTLLETYRQQAIEDELTNIPNRRYFNDAMQREWYAALRTSQCLSILFIDVDFFKKYNDGYGHVLGDKCLHQIAQLIKSNCMRPRDVCARFGGEEFVVILPDTDAQGCHVVAENIKKSVDDSNIPHAYSNCSASVTVSIGGNTVVPKGEKQMDYFIEKADRALYQAKESGRNTIVILNS